MVGRSGNGFYVIVYVDARAQKHACARVPYPFYTFLLACRHTVLARRLNLRLCAVLVAQEEDTAGRRETSRTTTRTRYNTAVVALRALQRRVCRVQVLYG